MDKDSKGGSDKKRSSKDHGATPAALDPSLFGKHALQSLTCHSAALISTSVTKRTHAA